MTLRHTDSQFQSELDSLLATFNHMGIRARSMVGDAVRAMELNDPDTARRVIAADRDLDRIELEVDRMCLTILARRAPVGEDLRLVTAAMKAVTDLERVGDLAVNIAERALDLYGRPGIEPGPEVGRLALAALNILDRALHAFRERDSAEARELYELDQQVDSHNRLAFRNLIHLTQVHPDQFERALALSSICRHLERVGDHAVNIGERVIFLVEGEEVRHRGQSVRGGAPIT